MKLDDILAALGTHETGVETARRLIAASNRLGAPEVVAIVGADALKESRMIRNLANAIADAAKPDDPLRLEALVRDNYEMHWLRRSADRDHLVWQCIETGEWRYWRDIAVATDEQILFRGREVTS